MGYRDTPPGTGPGFYQGDAQHGAVGGPRLSGRKTGRVAPRDHVRQPAWEDTLQRHDLLPMHDSQVGSNATFNRNQGQLFDPQVVAPRDTRPDAEVARSLGAPTGEIKANKSKQTPLLGATPGFMPGLTTKQKVGAITSVGEARAVTGASRGGSPFAEIMEDRGAHNKRPADWYMGVDSSGVHHREQQGEAAKQIAGAAARTGSSFSNMARAVANTSPQMGWKSEGSTDDPTAGQTDRMAATSGMHPNLAVAEDVVRTASRAQRRGANVVQELDARQFVSREDRATEVASSKTMVEHPSALGGATDGRVKAGMNRVREMTSDSADMGPYTMQDIKSQKAANFDASLNLSHHSPSVQRIAAQSYTVDRHDGTSVGINVESKEFNRRGVYEAVAMTGRRAALKNRELPPNEQAMEWESHRASKGLGQGNQLFQAGTTVPRPELAAPASASKPPTSRSITRDKRGSLVPDDITPF